MWEPSKAKPTDNHAVENIGPKDPHDCVAVCRRVSHASWVPRTYEFYLSMHSRIRIHHHHWIMTPPNAFVRSRWSYLDVRIGVALGWAQHLHHTKICPTRAFPSESVNPRSTSAVEVGAGYLKTLSPTLMSVTARCAILSSSTTSSSGWVWRCTNRSNHRPKRDRP